MHVIFFWPQNRIKDLSLILHLIKYFLLQDLNLFFLVIGLKYTLRGFIEKDLCNIE